MAAPNHQMPPISTLSQIRRRTADGVAERLRATAIHGGTTIDLDEWDLSISEHPVLQRILTEVPVVACSMLDCDWLPEIATMTRAILAVLDQPNPPQ